MAVTLTSLAAYDSVELNARQADVLAAIRALHEAGRHPSDQDLAEALGWSINRVTPRRGELVAYGEVVRTGTKIAKTGRVVMTWMPATQQLKLFGGME